MDERNRMNVGLTKDHESESVEPGANVSHHLQKEEKKFMTKMGLMLMLATSLNGFPEDELMMHRVMD